MRAALSSRVGASPVLPVEYMQVAQTECGVNAVQAKTTTSRPKGSRRRCKVWGAVVFLALLFWVSFWVIRAALDPYLVHSECEWAERAEFHDVVFAAFVKDARRCNLTWWLDGGSLIGAAHRREILPWDKDIDVGMLVPRAKTRTANNPNKADLTPTNGCWFNDGWESTALGRIPGLNRSNLAWFAGALKFSLPRLKGELDIYFYYLSDDNRTVRQTFGRSNWRKGAMMYLDFPREVVLPTSTTEFYGVPTNTPNQIQPYLNLAYPFTMGILGILIPFKPACITTYPAVPLFVTSVWLCCVCLLWRGCRRDRTKLKRSGMHNMSVWVAPCLRLRNTPRKYTWS